MPKSPTPQEQSRYDNTRRLIHDWVDRNESSLSRLAARIGVKRETLTSFANGQPGYEPIRGRPAKLKLQEDVVRYCFHFDMVSLSAPDIEGAGDPCHRGWCALHANALHQLRDPEVLHPTNALELVDVFSIQAVHAPKPIRPAMATNTMATIGFLLDQDQSTASPQLLINVDGQIPSLVDLMAELEDSGGSMGLENKLRRCAGLSQLRLGELLDCSDRRNAGFGMLTKVISGDNANDSMVLSTLFDAIETELNGETEIASSWSRDLAGAVAEYEQRFGPELLSQMWNLKSPTRLREDWIVSHTRLVAELESHRHRHLLDPTNDLVTLVQQGSSVQNRHSSVLLDRTRITALGGMTWFPPMGLTAAGEPARRTPETPVDVVDERLFVKCDVAVAPYGVARAFLVDTKKRVLLVTFLLLLPSDRRGQFRAGSAPIGDHLADVENCSHLGCHVIPAVNDVRILPLFSPTDVGQLFRQEVMKSNGRLRSEVTQLVAQAGAVV